MGHESSFTDRLQSRLTLKHLPALDGMRAICVFVVMVYHYGYRIVTGDLGVLGFFVLSGFLITWLLLKEHDKHGTISIPLFYKRRALRIFPAFYAFLLGCLAFYTITGRPGIDWKYDLSAALYVSNYYKALAHPADTSFVGHTWSLAIEEQFYLLWPLALLFCLKDLVRLRRILVVVIGCVWLHRILLKLVFGVGQSYIYNAFDTRLDHLMVGCLCAVVLKTRAWNGVWRVAGANVFMPAVPLALICLSAWARHAYGANYRDLIGFAVDPFLIAVLMVQWVTLSGHSLWRWLDSAVIRYLGRISYSLYLYQDVVLPPAKRLLGNTPEVVRFLGAMGATIGIASLSYFFIEKPFLRLKERIGSVRKKAAERPVDELIRSRVQKEPIFQEDK